MAKYINKSKLLGKIGTENYRVSDCPVHLPKENVKFFMAMQDAGNKDPFSSNTWENQITPGWKKPFHESIVFAISKGIKNALNESNEFNFNSNNILNEGSWGYEPNDGDGPLDMRYDINLSIFEKIYDRCKKCINNAKKEHYASWAWDVIGQIEYFFDRATGLDNLADKPDKKFEKYDFWWKLKSKKKKDILELYKEALDICENDKKWINEWSEPKRIIASLKRRHNFLDKFLKIQEQKDNYEKKLKEKQLKNARKEKEFVPDIVAEGFMFEGECGGVGGSYNTPMNTVGVGNVVPAQGAAMTGTQQASDMFNGSGDLIIPKSQKKSKKNKSKNSGIIYFPLATKKGV